MKPPHDSAPAPEIKTIITPVERKAHLYKMMTLLWCFPSLGGIVILGLNGFSGPPNAAGTQGAASLRIEDLAAVGLLATHCYLAVQARRFHRLNQARQHASLTKEQATEPQTCPSTNTNSTKATAKSAAESSHSTAPYPPDR
ncbi:MAG: hypothetical protein M2R45_05493 [Verrucomicrobia subdivision 3 bacterium]|nr:hypothetical protein [Limisphaerales bacterium]